MKKLVKLGFSSLITALAAKVKWSKILGTSLSFNLFNVLAPANAVLFGRSSVFIVLLADLFLLLLKPKLALLRVLLFLPMVLATYYYAELLKGNKQLSYAAFLFMLLFWINPTGRKAWPYALLWLAILLPHLNNNLFFKALSTQFFDHAVGSLVFLYFADIPASIWLSAIPIAIFERLLMATGLTFVSWLALKLVQPEEEAMHISTSASA